MFSYNAVQSPHAYSAPKRRLKFLASALVVVALAIAATILGTSGSRPPSAAAAEVVGHALSSTLTETSLSFTLTENVQVAGQTVSVAANGACTLSADLCNMTMNFSGSPALAAVGSITAVVANGTMYEKFDSSIDSRLPTPWVSAPTCPKLACATNSPSGIGSPLSMLATLANGGAVVTDVGPTTLNGAQVSEYSVTFSKGAAKGLVDNELKKFPAWLRNDSAVTSAAAGLGAISEKVYIGQNKMLSAITMSTTMSVAGQSANVAVTYDITGYGVPVNVTVPPANQVTPISQISSSLG